MEIQRAGSGGQWKISGAIEITDADALHDGLCSMVGGHAVVELDLSEVTHCDPSSLQLFCSALKTAQRLGGRLHLSDPSQEVRLCCESLGLKFWEAGEFGRHSEDGFQASRFGIAGGEAVSAGGSAGGGNDA